MHGLKNKNKFCNPLTGKIYIGFIPVDNDVDA